MTRGIDHLVVNVRYLDAAVARYQELGFTTTPRAVHPFGTANNLVQLQGNFIELVTVVDEAKIAPRTSEQFSFGAFCRDYQARREGMSMLVFHSNDARADQAEFAAKGLATYAPFDFQRKARLPDGTEVTVGFSLAFVTLPIAPQAAFFCCQQHAPQHFWRPEYQNHANGAQRISEVLMVADDPLALADFFAAIHGPDSVSSCEHGLRVHTALGRISVHTHAHFMRRFPDSSLAGAPPSPHFAGFQITVEDLEEVRRIFGTNGVAFAGKAGSVYIPSEHALGLTLGFHE